MHAHKGMPFTISVGWYCLEYRALVCTCRRGATTKPIILRSSLTLVELPYIYIYCLVDTEHLPKRISARLRRSTQSYLS